MPVNTLPSRNEIISELFNELRPMVFNFARKYDLEFDDCLQNAAVIMLEAWPNMPTENINIKAYLNSSVRRRLYDILRRREQEAVSLDAPITPQSTETFADMLQVFTQKRDEAREDFIAQVTHAALKRCKLEEQMYARERFGLNSFNPVLPDTASKPNYSRTKGNMRKCMNYTLHKDPQLLALMQ